jgi:hypothetical protein
VAKRGSPRVNKRGPTEKKKKKQKPQWVMRAARTSTIGGPSCTLGVGGTIRPEPTLSVRCTTASTAGTRSGRQDGRQVLAEVQDANDTVALCRLKYFELVCTHDLAHSGPAVEGCVVHGGAVGINVHAIVYAIR